MTVSQHIDKKSSNDNLWSILFAGVIFIAWLILIIVNLFFIKELSYWMIPLVFLQAHLFSGLFIIAHDSMHGNIHSNKLINHTIGQICLWIYAAFKMSDLIQKHHLHHAFVATSKDPDYSKHGFWKWYVNFVWPYLHWKQFAIMALVFNCLHWVFGVGQLTLVLFWILPLFLSTLQLFYFGTYLPHRRAETINNSLKSRSMARNHLWALLSCYFFGYHYEHHRFPRLPWWRLWTKV